MFSAFSAVKRFSGEASKALTPEIAEKNNNLYGA